VRTGDELRGHILAAARAEFARNGLAGSRIDRIARAANASKERLYAHFGDKEALFREVVLVDFTDFYRSVSLSPADVPEFAGQIFDLAHQRPEHLRMVTWARLEGFGLGDPRPGDGDQPFDQAISAIEHAQAQGWVDSRWQAEDLLVLLFGVALAWAQSPEADASNPDSGVTAHRRACAVEAARRIIATR
jgi:AcrR family transcriptional regulator